MQLRLLQPFCKARLCRSTTPSALGTPSIPGTVRLVNTLHHKQQDIKMPRTRAEITHPCARSCQPGKPQPLCSGLLRPWGAPALTNLSTNPFAPVQRGTAPEKRQSWTHKPLQKAAIAALLAEQLKVDLNWEWREHAHGSWAPCQEELPSCSACSWAQKTLQHQTHLHGRCQYQHWCLASCTLGILARVYLQPPPLTMS